MFVLTKDGVTKLWLSLSMICFVIKKKKTKHDEYIDNLILDQCFILLFKSEYQWVE